MQKGPKDVGRINWTVEVPNRPFLGNGHTGAEAVLTHVSATMLSAFAAAYWWWVTDAPALWQAVILAIFAYDILGGAVANSLNSCKRFYHAAHVPDESALVRASRNPLIFTAIHLHPVVFALIFGFPLALGVAYYIAVWLSVRLVTWAPLYLRRPAAMALGMAALLLSQTIFALPVGLGWVVPGLFLKLVLGHAVQEEPYRP